MSLILSHYNAGSGAILVETREEARFLGDMLAELPQKAMVASIAAPGGTTQAIRGKADPVQGLVPAYAWAAAASGRVLVVYDWHTIANNPGSWRALIEKLPALKSPPGGKNDPASLVVFVAPAWDLSHANPLRGVLPVVKFAPPDRETLKKMAASLCPTNGLTDAVADALCGLTAIAAEQTAAECLAECKKWDASHLRATRRKVLEDAGLKVLPAYNFAAMRGMSGWKDAIKKRVIPWMRDEQLAVRCILCSGLPGLGKCLGRGTPVLMFDGSIKTVEDIVNGDVLMGPDSGPRIVSGTISGHGPLYQVTPTKGSSYIVNEHHILSLKQSGTDKIVNISINDYLKKGAASRERLKGWRTDINWPREEVAIPPYIMGVWLGDGTCMAPNVTTADVEIVAELEIYAESMNMKLVPYQKKSAATTYGVTGCSTSNGRNPFVSALRGYGLFATSKRIPQQYLVNDKATRLELLAGLIDTDGYLCDGGGYEISTVSSDLASDILFLARSLGFAAYVSAQEKFCQTGGGGVYFRIGISGDPYQVPCRLKRKRQQRRRQIKDVLKTGISVKAIGEGEYFGFCLDADHLFVLGDFTVTHNTYGAQCLAGEVGADIVELDLESLKSAGGGIVGQAGAAMERGLEALDAMGCESPVVVLLDELEKLASEGMDGGTSSGMHSSLLKWLQKIKMDPKSRILVIGTVNEAGKLSSPLENRFQMRFWFDLLTIGEREQIAEYHYKRLGCKNVAEAAKITAELTDGFVAREIAETVCPDVAALTNREPSEEAIREVVAGIVPTSKIKAEDFDRMREAAAAYRRANDPAEEAHVPTGRRVRGLTTAMA